MSLSLSIFKIALAGLFLFWNGMYFRNTRIMVREKLKLRNGNITFSFVKKKYYGFSIKTGNDCYMG